LDVLFDCERSSGIYPCRRSRYVPVRAKELGSQEDVRRSFLPRLRKRFAMRFAKRPPVRNLLRTFRVAPAEVLRRAKRREGNSPESRRRDLYANVLFRFLHKFGQGSQTIPRKLRYKLRVPGFANRCADEFRRG